MQDRYLYNLGIALLKVVKKIIRYLQLIKDCMLTYRRSDELQMIGYTVRWEAAEIACSPPMGVSLC